MILLLEKKKKRLGRLLRYVLPYGGRNREAFNNCESLDQTIKNSFLNLFWDWVKLYIRDGSLSVLEFVDWLESL